MAIQGTKLIAKIQTKRSAAAGREPTAGSLLAGEIAVNTADAAMFTSTNGSDIVRLTPRVFIQATDPALDGVTLQRGDLWIY